MTLFIVFVGVYISSEYIMILLDPCGSWTASSEFTFCFRNPFPIILKNYKVYSSYYLKTAITAMLTYMQKNEFWVLLIEILYSTTPQLCAKSLCNPPEIKI